MKSKYPLLFIGACFTYATLIAFVIYIGAMSPTPILIGIWTFVLINFIFMIPAFLKYLDYIKLQIKQHEVT